MFALQRPARVRRPGRRVVLPAFHPDPVDAGGDWLAALARPELGPLKTQLAPMATVPVGAKLDANESPFALSASAAADLGATLAAVALHRYGDDAACDLRRIVAAAAGVPGEQICFGHGSYELIGMLVAAFSRPRTGRARAAILYPTPTFFGYRSAAVLHGAEPVEVPLLDDMALDLLAVDRALATRRPNVAFFCRPNNPTGTLWPLAGLLTLVERHPDVLFVIDEVYCAYAGESWLDLVTTRPNVVVLRSLSKLGGAAVRVGYAIGPADVIAQLERVRPPFTVNGLSGAAAAWLLTRGAPHVAAAVAAVVAERKRVETILAAVPGAQVFASHANYLLVRFGTAGDGRARALWQRLQARGVLVSCFDAPGPLAGCLRVTIGSPEENDLFLAVLHAEWTPAASPTLPAGE